MRISAAGDHVIVFAGKVFRYQRGDKDARAEAMDSGWAMGVADTSWTGQTDMVRAG